MEPTTQQTTMEPKKSNSALIGAIIVVIILILGGLYIMTSMKPIDTNITIPETQQTTTSNTESAATINAYEELNSLENDLNTTSGAETVIDIESVE